MQILLCWCSDKSVLYVGIVWLQSEFAFFVRWLRPAHFSILRGGMQKVVTIRASQKDLEFAIEKFISFGWRVVNTTKGSELGRVGFSYKWTIILEISDYDLYVDAKIDSIVKEFSSKSFGKTALLYVGTIVGFVALFTIVFAALL